MDDDVVFAEVVLGAPPGDPSRGVVALRSRAARLDVALGEVSPLDAVVAVATAEFVCALSGLTRIDDLASIAPQYAPVMARVYMRAAGFPAPPAARDICGADGGVSDGLAAVIDRCGEWLAPYGPDAVERVADDLFAGPPDAAALADTLVAVIGAGGDTAG